MEQKAPAPAPAPAPTTRDRLIDATVELVARRGYAGTTVGDIESRAGLAPRSGALYKYFGSKLEALDAGVERHLTAVASTATMAEVPRGNLEAELEALARWLLAELDREELITYVIEREGSRLPSLRDRMRTEVGDPGYRAAARFLARWSERLALPTPDEDALAVLLVGSLINVRRSAWTFNAAPLGIADDRIIAAFVAASARWFQQETD